MSLSAPCDTTTDTVLGVQRSASGQRWKWRTLDERAVLAMTQKLAIPDLLARVLVGRGVALEEAEDFLNPTLRTSMPDPSHLQDMDKAVARLVQAVERGETVGVFGDYDVDGATSSALMCQYLHAIGVPCETYIPDRMKEGYGPNEAAFLWLKEQGVSLVATVDCGAVSFEPLAAAKAAGLDVIVLDHHMGAAQLPEAVAVVNPNRLDETSPCRYLAAVGVTFLTVVALNRALREQGFFKDKQEPQLLDYLDLVALGTVCDVVPLTGLNRAFVKQGLQVMAQKKNPGIRALFDAARLDETPGTYHAGFILGPRINAGGRVGESSLGLKLLTTTDPEEAATLAARLSQYNAERQAIEACVLDEAMALAERQDNRAVIIVEKEGWHEGVIGIVAGRLKEKFHRPAAVVAFREGAGKASARSVPDVDFGAAIAAARTEGMILGGGGHAMAAGFSLTREQLPAFHDFLEARLGASADQYRHNRNLSIDACLNPDAVTLELPDIVAQAGPFGQANPTPRFVLAHCRVMAADVLKESHIRLTLACASRKGTRTTALAFRSVGTPLGELLLNHRGQPIHLTGQVKKEYWQGQARVSFFIDDAALAV
jgi:single-stranded-DNA-specific exonuclease